MEFPLLDSEFAWDLSLFLLFSLTFGMEVSILHSDCFWKHITCLPHRWRGIVEVSYITIFAEVIHMTESYTCNVIFKKKKIGKYM